MSHIKDNATKELNGFFDGTISKEEFAHYMRKFAHAGIMLNFEAEDSNYQKEVEDGYYWLTQLVERLDPVLFKQN